MADENIKRVIDDFFTGPSPLTVKEINEEPITTSVQSEPIEPVDPPINATIDSDTESQNPIEPIEPVDNPDDSDDPDEYNDLSETQLYAEVAKEEGLLPADYDTKKITDPVTLLKDVAELTKSEIEKKYQDEYSDINFELYTAFLKGELETSEGQQVAREISTMNYFTQLDVDDIDEETKENRINVLRYYYENIKGLPPTAVQATIQVHFKDGTDVDMAQVAQKEINNIAITRKNQYFQNLKNEEQKVMDKINGIIDNTNLDGLYLKSEDQRKKLKAIFNNKTEKIVRKDSRGRSVVHEKTRADIIIEEMMSDPKKLVLAVSILENLNNLNNVETGIKKSKKDKLYEAIKTRQQKESQQQTQTTKYPHLDYFKSQQT